MDALKHRDRFSIAPRLNKRGRPIIAQMIDRQPAILKALNEHGTLTVYDLHRIVGGDLRSLRYSVDILKNKPNEYIRILPEQVRRRTLRENLFYQLGPNGVEWLNKSGTPAQNPQRVYNVGHTGLVSHIMASIKAGVAQHSYARFISWDEIKAHPKFPHGYDGRDDKVRPDTHPFRIQLTQDGIPSWRTIVVEADNGTESIKTRIREKYDHYLNFMRNEEYKKRYGLSNYFVLFVFTSRQRMDNAKAELAKLGPNRFVLFQQAYQDPETPAGYVFTSACERVGFPPLFLSQP